MRKIELNPKDIYNGNLLLVNSDYPINEDYYVPKTMIPVDIDHRHILLDFKAATVLGHIIDEIGGRDFIVPVSGYRPGEEQEAIYLASLKENGRNFTEKYVAQAGHSEHKIGLAIDLGKKQEKIDFIRPEFPYEGIYNEFRRKAIKYGFIERYEKEKEEITKIAQEPWHFRYVGYPHSKIMKMMGFCLEEYIEFLKAYSYNESFAIEVDNHHVEIFYIPMLSTKSQIIHLPKDKICQISGNNVDGCIVTLWK